MKAFRSPLLKLALLAAAAAPLSQAMAAGEFATPDHLGPDDRCTAASDRGLTVRGRLGSRDILPVWRAGGAPLSFGGGQVKFTVWGNVDLANDIRLDGITRESFTVGAKRGGAANAARGCGARGSVDITLRTANFPTAAQPGRLRFNFPLGAPFEVPMRLQPVPGSLDLRWPSRPAGSGRIGEHHACLQANGGHVRVDGDTLEIGLNPDNPLPQGCSVHSLEVFDLRGLPALPGFGFRGGDAEANRSVTVVQGLAGSPAFATGQTHNINGLGGMISSASGRLDATGLFPALSIDYAAAARALRAPQLSAPSTALAPRTGISATRFTGTGTGAAAPAAPAAPRTIEFTLAMPSFNNVPNLHAPMRVRLVAVASAATSNLEATMDVATVCSNPMQLRVRDTSTGALAITRRELDGGAGQRIAGGAQPLDTVLTYAQPGNFTVTLSVADASGATRQARQAVSLPRAACTAVAPPTVGGVRIVSGSGSNLLPVRLFPERPLLRRIGGLGPNVMLPIGLCTGLDNDARGEVAVPPLVWGVSSAGDDAASARAELRDAASGAVLSAFDAGRVAGNSAAATRENYPGRPARIAVVNVTGSLLPSFGNQAGCFLDPDVAAPRLDPDFLLVVDPNTAVSEGPDAATAELDNELRF